MCISCGGIQLRGAKLGAVDNVRRVGPSDGRRDLVDRFQAYRRTAPREIPVRADVSDGNAMRAGRQRRNGKRRRVGRQSGLTQQHRRVVIELHCPRGHGRASVWSGAWCGRR